MACLLRHVWDLSAQLHYGQAQLAAGDLHHSSTVAVRVGSISNPATFAGHARRVAPEIEQNLVLFGNADALILQHGTVREQVPGGCFRLTALALRHGRGCIRSPPATRPRFDGPAAPKAQKGLVDLTQRLLPALPHRVGLGLQVDVVHLFRLKTVEAHRGQSASPRNDP